MKLYVCYGTFGAGKHPCGKAYKALIDAGYEPEVKRVYGSGMLPNWINPTRRQVRKLTGGSNWVPILVDDDGKLLAKSSSEVLDWAKANPRS